MSSKSYLKVQSAAPKVLQSELRSDAPSNPQVIPEIQHFLKNMTPRPKLLVKGNLHHLALGDSLSLECSLSGQGNKVAKALFWTREQGKDISNTAEQQVLDSGKISLKIPALTKRDKGTYICLSDDMNVVPVSVNVDVLGKGLKSTIVYISC